jgi:hypothetical protein
VSKDVPAAPTFPSKTRPAAVRARLGSRRWVVAALGVALAFAAAPAGAADPLILTATPVRVAAGTVIAGPGGRLTFRGGLILRSRDRRFGGLSGLAVSADGATLLAVSNAGWWLSGRLIHDADGVLTGLADMAIARIRGPDGAPTRGKSQSDAEGLARAPDGGYVVSLESPHRLWRYPPGDAPWDSTPEVLALPEDLSARGNAGVEALGYLGDGRLLVLCEGCRAGGDLRGWAMNGEWRALAYPHDGFHRPSDLAVLSDGRVLVLERGFSLWRGIDARLMWAAPESLGPDRRARLDLIATIEQSELLDNFEGLAARPGPNGETLIYLVSDNNFSPLQQTLLLHFELSP